MLEMAYHSTEYSSSQGLLSRGSCLLAVPLQVAIRVEAKNDQQNAGYETKNCSTTDFKCRPQRRHHHKQPHRIWRRDVAEPELCAEINRRVEWFASSFVLVVVIVAGCYFVWSA